MGLYISICLRQTAATGIDNQCQRISTTDSQHGAVVIDIKTAESRVNKKEEQEKVNDDKG